MIVGIKWEPFGSLQKIMIDQVDETPWRITGCDS